MLSSLYLSMDTHFVVDVETCPINLEGYFDMNEKEQKELLNPIDSRIVAIGVRKDGNNTIIMNDDEKLMLADFWKMWREFKNENRLVKIVGFNIANFDLPFLVMRSFINNVAIQPFILKEVIELRDKINAYKMGRRRGRLKEFAQIMGFEIMDVNGGDVARLWSERKLDVISEYLKKDLEFTDAMYDRALKTRIIEIERW